MSFSLTIVGLLFLLTGVALLARAFVFSSNATIAAQSGAPSAFNADVLWSLCAQRFDLRFAFGFLMAGMALMVLAFAGANRAGGLQFASLAALYIALLYYSLMREQMVSADAAAIAQGIATQKRPAPTRVRTPLAPPRLVASADGAA